MKLKITSFFLIFTLVLQAQKLDGAWQLTHVDGVEVVNKEVIRIYQDGYFAYGAKKTEDDTFLKAGGGTYTIDGNQYIETQDFNTAATSEIGLKKVFTIQLSGQTLEISDGEKNKVWKKLSAATDDLTRNWVITGRQRNETMNRMTPGDRRTIKILSGGRFQWVAFNSATKQFSGTGGGTYTAKDGVYTENITFFSRDNSRVGASLEFDYEVKDGEWHHSGKSSGGEPIYEIWSPYAEAYNPQDK